MPQIILIHDSLDQSNVYKLNLSNYIDLNVVQRNNATHAIELLKILPEYDLIITQANIGSEYTALDLNKYIKKNKLHIPLIVLGDCPELVNKVLTLKEPTAWEVLIHHTGKLLGEKLIAAKSVTKESYSPVNINYFYDISHTPCDIYIRIKKSKNEFQYIKRFNEDENFTVEEVKKFSERGLKYFYVPSNYKEYFTTFITNSILEKIQTKLSIEDRLKITANSYSIINQYIRTMGVTDEINELARASIKSMILGIKKAPKLAAPLKILLSNQISYAYQKAHLSCIIGNFILSKQPWYEEKFLKLMAHLSFACDLTLKSKSQIQIMDLDELSSAFLSDEEKSQVLNHAHSAAQIIEIFDHYKDRDALLTLIKQHHGSADGVGFKFPPEDNLHGIAKVFIIADSFTKMLLSSNYSNKKTEILEELKSRYTAPDFQYIIKTLEQKIE